MKIAVFSDVHANPLALDAVLADAETQGCETYWFLGDLTGRGPGVIEVAQRLHRLYLQVGPEGWLAGNHDQFVTGKIDANTFIQSFKMQNPQANFEGSPTDDVEIDNRHALMLSGDSYKDLLAWIRALPTYAMPREHFYIAHAAYNLDPKTGQVDPYQSYRYYTWYSAQVMDQFSYLRASEAPRPHVIAIGHTHVASLWRWERDRPTPQLLMGWTPSLAERKRWGAELFGPEIPLEGLGRSPILFNPGSVGFPRDPDTCPTYAILTVHSSSRVTLQFREVPYDWGPLVFVSEDGSRRGPMAPPYPASLRQQVTRCTRPAAPPDHKESN